MKIEHDKLYINIYAKGQSMSSEQKTYKRLYKKSWPRKGTIGNLVLEFLIKNSNTNLDYDKLHKIVHKKFPNSKFKKSHFVWYKHQLKISNYSKNSK